MVDSVDHGAQDVFGLCREARVVELSRVDSDAELLVGPLVQEGLQGASRGDRRVLLGGQVAELALLDEAELGQVERAVNVRVGSVAEGTPESVDEEVLLLELLQASRKRAD